MTIGLRQLRVTRQFHPDLYGFLDRVRRAGGSVPEYGVSAHNRFINRLVNAGLWTKMKSANGFIMTLGTSSFQGLFVPLVAPAGVSPINVNFVSADYSPSTGLDAGAGNNTKHIDTGWVPSTHVTSTSNQLSVYSRTDADGATGTSPFPNEARCSSSATSDMGMHIRLSNAAVLDAYIYDIGDADSAGGRTQTTSTLSGAAMVTGSRVSTTDARLFRNGVALGTVNANAFSGTLPIHNMFLFASNFEGVAEGWSRRTNSYFYLGNGLSAEEESIHYQAVQELQVAYGRAV